RSASYPSKLQVDNAFQLPESDRIRIAPFSKDITPRRAKKLRIGGVCPYERSFPDRAFRIATANPIRPRTGEEKAVSVSLFSVWHRLPACASSHHLLGRAGRPPLLGKDAAIVSSSGMRLSGPD